MIKFKTRLLIALIVPAAAMLVGATSLTKGVFLNPGDLVWMNAKPPLPPAVKIAVLIGDPSKAGEYTMRLKLPAGTRVPPHRHGEDENATVISGTAGIGIGPKWEQYNLRMMGPGSFFSIPSDVPHYVWAKTDVVIQIHSTGPRTTVFMK